MQGPHEHCRYASAEVERRGIEIDHALIVCTEEVCNIKRADLRLSFHVLKIHHHPRFVIALPSQGDVAELVLAPQVVYQQLELPLELRHVKRYVVCATGRFCHLSQLRFLEHIADTDREQLCASLQSILACGFSRRAAAGVPSVGQEYQDADGARVLTGAGEEVRRGSHTIPNARRSGVESAAREAVEAFSYRLAVGGKLG